MQIPPSLFRIPVQCAHTPVMQSLLQAEKQECAKISQKTLFTHLSWSASDIVVLADQHLADQHAILLSGLA